MLIKGENTGILPSTRKPSIGAWLKLPGSLNREPAYTPIPPDNGSGCAFAFVQIRHEKQMANPKNLILKATFKR
jgi:hypothetical protein